MAPVRAAPGYRVALFLVTIGMLLLPCVYIALVAAVGWLVLWWASHGLVVFTGHRVGLWTFVIYFAPLAIGGLLVLFMVKPLFARRGGQQQVTSIDRRTQPLLVAYIDALCASMRAPVPSRIDVDVRVNASASFRRGLMSMIGNDLVLTIGLPLAATMSVRELTAVLAHEFGHFSQGVGMRFSYLTVVINRWFARVVYERDAWDERLTEWSRECDMRIAIILWLARAGIWMSRRVLWVLMHIGHLLSSLLSRQMEFDADRHAIHVTGHQPFIATMRLLPVLDLAERGAHSDLGQAWAEGRLGDDLPALVQMNFTQITDEQRKQAIAEAMAGQPGMYASHPATGVRIARAEATAMDGIIGLNGPASGLFVDFPGLCRAASLDHYRQVIGPVVAAKKLQPTAVLVAEAAAIQRQHQAAERVWGELWGWARVFDPRGRADDARPAAIRFQEATQAFTSARDTSRDAVAAWISSARDQSRFRIASELVTAGQAVSLRDFGVTEHTALIPAVARLNRTVAERAAVLAPAEHAARERIAALLELAEEPVVHANLEAAGCPLPQLTAAREALAALAGKQDEIRDLRLSYSELSALCEHLDAHREEQRYIETLISRLGDVVKALGSLHRVAAAYPFAHQRDDTSLGFFLVPELPGKQDLGSAMQAGGMALQRCFEVHHRCLGVLAQAIEAIEAIAATPAGPTST